MDDQTERDRCRAIERYLKGETPTAVAGSMGYSAPWLYKWAARFKTGDPEWYRDASRRPRESPRRTQLEIESAVKVVRGDLEREGRFFGDQAIRWELEDLGIRPLPSLRTINRILDRAGLTRRSRERYLPKGKKYPKLKGDQPGEAHQTDFVGPLHLRGGFRYYVLNSVDLATGRCASEPMRTKTAQATLDAFWASWIRLGMPRHQQVDNEMSFYGSPRHPRGMGPLIRLSLTFGIEVWFIPMREPWRNGVVEKFNHHWEDRFLRRVEITSEADLRIQDLGFEGRHNSRYRYSKLGGKTPAEALRLSGCVLRFPAAVAAPRHPLPKPQTGRYHLIRFVRSDGLLNVFGEIFPAPPEATYEYVRLTIDVERERLGVYLADLQIDEHRYRLER